MPKEKSREGRLYKVGLVMVGTRGACEAPFKRFDSAGLHSPKYNTFLIIRAKRSASLHLKMSCGVLLGNPIKVTWGGAHQLHQPLLL